MQSFLQTQREVMAAYLRGSSGGELTMDGSVPETPSSCTTPALHSNGVGPQSTSEKNAQLSTPGRNGASSIACPTVKPRPWVGEVRRWVPAPRSRRGSSCAARDDPIAQHHTLGGRKISAVDPSLLGLPVVPFAVMAEMAAQVAALVVDRDLVLTGIKRFEHTNGCAMRKQPVYLELRGRRVSSDG